MVIVAFTAQAIGLFISSLSPNVTSATAIAPAFTMPIVLFGGFITNNEAVGAYISWMEWVSPIRYANEALAHSQFDSYSPPKTFPPTPNLPEGYLELEGFTIGYWNCVFIVIGLMLFWRIFSLIVLKAQIGKV